MLMEAREEFLNEVESRLHRMFSASRQGYRAASVDRNRLEGFIECGVFMNLATRREMAKLMENVHFSVFNKSIRERQEERAGTWQYDVIDYRKYDQPTYDRLKR